MLLPIFLAVISLLSLLPKSYGSESTYEATHAAGIVKLSDTLYTGRCQDVSRVAPNTGEVSKDTLYFVMQRIDQSVPGPWLDIWRSFVKQEKKVHFPAYQETWDQVIKEAALTQKSLPQGYLKIETKDFGGKDRLTVGWQSFALNIKSYAKYNELWVAFTSRKPLHSEEDFKDLLTPANVEMALPVLAAAGPIQMHLGINRCFGYLKESAVLYLKDGKGFPLHKELSILLHAFAAKIKRFQDPRKIYMISSPAPAMSRILCNKLKQGIYWGDNCTRTFWELFLKKSIPYTQKGSWAMLDLSESKQRKYSKLLEKDWETQIPKPKEEMGPSDSPIERNGNLSLIRIYDPERKKVIYEWDASKQEVIIEGVLYKGDQALSYDWLNMHEHIPSQHFMTIDLQPLSSMIKLS